MTGKWVKREQDRHECDLPYVETRLERITAGDTWLCECGRTWTVADVWRGDQREPLEGRPQIRWIQ